MRLGNGLTETAEYRNRLQMTSLTAGTGLTLGLYYCPGGASSCTSNNGNVLRQTINAGGPVYTQDYTYDPVNRLWTFTESGQTQTFAYDRYGNRALLDTSYNPEGSSTPAVSTDNEAAVAQIFPSNRWTGAIHDSVGNETAVPGFQFAYDAENRLTTVTHPNFSTIAYAYDGDGRRVKKTVNTSVTVYVYDASGQLAAEYGAPAGVGGTQYLTADHLGSTRMVTNASGAPTQRFDYLPFGGELPAGFNSRSALYSPAMYPSTPLATTNLFTGQMRDAETGLDYFGARYFSGAQGRFTSPDEFKGGIVDPFTGQQVGQPGPLPYADITDPQTLNKYAYVRNNPLRYVDPDSHADVDWDEFLVNSTTALGSAMGMWAGGTIGGGGGTLFAPGVGTFGGAVAGAAAGSAAGGFLGRAVGVGIVTLAKMLDGSKQSSDSNGQSNQSSDKRAEYENPGHHDPSSGRGMPQKDPLPKDAADVYKAAVKDSGRAPGTSETYYGRTSDGQYYRHQGSNGKVHWNGTVKREQVPNAIRKILEKQVQQ